MHTHIYLYVGDQAYTNGNSWDYCGAAAKSVQIKVKVWLESQLPPADFNSTWLPIKSNAGEVHNYSMWSANS